MREQTLNSSNSQDRDQSHARAGFLPASVRIAKARAREFSEIRRICCETGNAGAPIAKERWDFFGDLWIGPYEKLLPQWTYVASVEDQILGYLTGCPSTAQFESRKRLKIFPLLWMGILRRSYRKTSDTRRFLKRSLGLSKSPERCFSGGFLKMLYVRYPAHLHINIDSRVRGRNLGRSLVEGFLRDLKREEVSGVHVFCGDQARGFYRSLGFQELKRISYRTDSRAGATPVYAMGRLLRA
ncbi:MAG: GNAT family N-acetyltransferase [Bdellovibrionota bacterium]